MAVRLFLMLVAVAAEMVLAAAGTSEPGPLSRSWLRWKALHQRSYDAEEDNRRAATYEKNADQITAFNKKNHTFKLGLNSFMDLTLDEFYLIFAKRDLHERLTSSFPSLGSHSGPPSFNLTNLPGKVDWRKSGAVSPVEFQGVCGSCWTFTGVGAIESIIKIKKGVLLTLSKQQIVDCATVERGQAFKGDDGCQGGNEWDVPTYAHQYGICLASDYEYYGVKKFSGCDKDVVSGCTGGVSKGMVKGVMFPTPRSETALLSAVAQQPVAASIISESFAFVFYQSGIFTDCDFDDETDHAVLIVGYGKDYWLVKNSFGTMWGEQGYIRMSRSAGGDAGCCGIQTVPSYPVLENVEHFV